MRRLLDMESCIEAMTEVLASLAAASSTSRFARSRGRRAPTNLLGLMPSYRGGATPSFGLKEIVVVPSNPSRGLDTHMGGVLLHDGRQVSSWPC